MADLQAEMARFEAEVAQTSSQVNPQATSGPQTANNYRHQGHDHNQQHFRPPGQNFAQRPPWGNAPQNGPPRMPGPPRPPFNQYPGMRPPPGPFRPQNIPQNFPPPPTNSYANPHASNGPVSYSSAPQVQPQNQAQYSSGPQQSSQIETASNLASASQAEYQETPDTAPQNPGIQAQTYVAPQIGIPIQAGDAKVLAAAQSASLVQPGKRQSEVYSNIQEAFASQKASKKPKYGVARVAAGKKWIDPGLLEWPENDFRIFVGDLGNETNDEVLTKAFQKYPTFNKAKVVRDKKSNKTKGFGFVSFSDPIEGAKALREMDGKYVGNRPCKLKKSSWSERNQEEQKFVPGRKKNHVFGGAGKKGS